MRNAERGMRNAECGMQLLLSLLLLLFTVTAPHPPVKNANTHKRHAIVGACPSSLLVKIHTIVLLNITHTLPYYDSGA